MTNKNNKGWLWIAAGCMIIILILMSVFSVRNAAGGGIFGINAHGGMHRIGKDDKLTCNKMSIPMEKAKGMHIDYHSRNLYFYQGEGDTIEIKEYYYKFDGNEASTVSYQGDNAYINGGTENNIIFMGSLGNEERMEIYLPSEGIDELTLECSSGNVETKDVMNNQYNRLDMETHSGNIEWNNAVAKQVEVTAKSGNVTVDTIKGETSIDVSSGNVEIASLHGKAMMEAKSGNIEVTSFKGSGSMQASSGNIDLNLAEITGDISMKASSGNVGLHRANNDVSFELMAETSSGDIDTNLDGVHVSEDEDYASGTVGKNAKYQVNMRASSGELEID